MAFPIAYLLTARTGSIAPRAILALAVGLFTINSMISAACAESSDKNRIIGMTFPQPQTRPPSLLHKTQGDPYCPGGSGGCGGVCDSGQGPKVQCSPIAIPCYGGRTQQGYMFCNCPPARKCQ